MGLPSFRYHPDPIVSGSVVPSAETWRCCGKTTGHLYVGPVYAEADLDDSLCPWCIKDGSAHRTFDASFVDADTFGDDVPSGGLLNSLNREQGPTAYLFRCLKCEAARFHIDGP